MASPFSALTPAEHDAVLLSLKVAATATACSLPLGVLAAWALAKTRFPGRSLVSALLYLPLVLPPVVTGYALLLAFGAQGPLGQLLRPFGVVFAFRWTGAALAAGVMGFPLMVRAIRLSMEAVDPRLEQAAETLGARPLVRFLTITLPLAAPGVLAGAVLGFAKAMGEFGATITFVSNIPGETQTLPSAIWTLIQTPGSGPAITRLLVISLVISLGAVLASEWLAAAAVRRAAAR